MGTINDKKKGSNLGGFSAGWIILGCAIIAAVFFFGICGDAGNFDEKGKALKGNVFGILYEGGFVIPIVITLLLTVIALSFERIFAMNRASGKKNNIKFLLEAKEKINAGDIEGAALLCDEQKGSVANIVKAGLVRYRDVEQIENMPNAKRAELIQKEIDEATTLELPYLEKNLNIIAAISTLGTLFGLFGTVLGMIRSFAAMGDGTPDSTQLAVGISEALMNTAMGIGTGALAIISYTYFSGKIQTITDSIDELGFAIGQAFVKGHGGLTR